MGVINNYHSRNSHFLMQRFAFAFFLILLIFSTAITSPAQGQNDTGEKKTIESRYLVARGDFNDLSSEASLGKSREEWLKNARNFRKIYLLDPKSDYAPNCLFMLGKIYQEMFVRFQNKMDLDEAISYFSDAATIFPDNRLSDDSLWIVANIYLDDLHDPKKASEVLSRIVTDFANGDMQSQAAKKLKVLSQQYNTPLPPILVGNSQPSKLTDVLPVKYWSSNDYSRVVINASGPVAYKEQLLEQSGDKPRRLFIDFFNSYIAPQYRAPVPIEDGLLKRIRTGQYNTDTVRVVLDIESISSYKVFSLADPFRVVVDVRGKNKQETPVPVTQKSAQPTQPTKTPEKAPSQIIVLHDSKKNPVNSLVAQNLPVQNSPGSSSGKSISLAQQLGLRVKTIVLDPGHGGKDPGAIAYGLKEKDIVLKVAKKLAPLIQEKLGCKVILTRTTDVFIPLEERTAIANTHDADLFVSLHINASPSEKAYGIETYFLNLTTNPEAMRVAAFENATSTHQMSDLQNILSDILKNSKINESSRLASQVHNSIIAGLGKDYSHIKNLGVKQAPFYVLIGAEMPAILVEMSFITNKDDARHLQNDHFLNSIANDISSGIQSYVSTNTASL
jgi:N-acetylmuramoyl-L-alanine amidase